MSLVLHVCCSPCAIYPIKSLKVNEDDLLLYYFNPNIHPYQEYQRRLEGFKQLAKELDLSIEVGEYRPELYFQAIGEVTEKPERCRRCYFLRLRETALLAKNRGIKRMTTTLLVSPYQEHKLVCEEGEKVAHEFELEFAYFDFRSGYYQGLNEARDMGIYRQWYCGCLFSEMERVKEKGAKKNAGA